MPPGPGPDWVETEVIEVCRPDRPEEPQLRPHVVVLRERDGTRRLPMFTGSAEAIALAGGVFHAAAVIEGPGGATEVDARSSDVVNLAVLAGAPIRVDAAILDDPVVDSHPEWEQYPARRADLVAEERRRRAAFQVHLAQAQENS